MLAVVKRVPSEMVNGTMLCCGHQPGARIIRDARLRSLSPAMILADSILQTASITRCVSVAVTINDHTTFDVSVQDKPRLGEPGRLFRGPRFERVLLWFGRKIFRIVDLANSGLALPSPANTSCEAP